MPVTNPITGEVQAYLEGDEGILNRTAMSDRQQYTVTGTPSQIASSLNSMSGGVSWENGATLTPAWTSYTPKMVNFQSVSDTLSNVRRFADGGVFNATSQPSSRTSIPATADPELKALMAATMQAVNDLRTQIAAGIWTNLSLTDLNKQQERLDNIRSNATFKPR